MKKRKIYKIVLIIIAVVVILFTIFLLWLSDAFTKDKVTDIASYVSPDEIHTLVFQQKGDPVFPYGPTTIRLVLKDWTDIEEYVVETTILDDGANASAENIKEVKWEDNKVTIILTASEMDDKEIVLGY